MPHGWYASFAAPALQVLKVGHPRRDRGKVKAGRKSARRSR